MKGYWNGEHATFRGVTYEVTEAKEGKLWWQNQFIGQRRQGIEITYRGETWIIDNEHGDGHEKVTRGMGSPRCSHKSISNPINIKYINDSEINNTVDVEAYNKEYHANREWCKKIDPVQFKKSEALRKSLAERRKKYNL